MQYLICDKENNMIEGISDNIVINEEDTSMFYDETSDCYYSTSEFVYYEFPNDDIPKYVRQYDYKYIPDAGFSRSWTMEEFREQRFAVAKAANMNMERVEETENIINALLGLE